MAEQSQAELDAFVAWFQSHGATVDATAMGVADIPGYGRGLVALRDLPVSSIVLLKKRHSPRWLCGYPGGTYVVHDSA